MKLSHFDVLKSGPKQAQIVFFDKIKTRIHIRIGNVWLLALLPNIAQANTYQIG
jgi:hypothetical protein